MLLQVVVSGEHDYSSPQVQQDMMELARNLENSSYIDPELSENWLREYLSWAERWADYPDYELDISTEKSFIKTLKVRWLHYVVVVVYHVTIVAIGHGLLKKFWSFWY